MNKKLFLYVAATAVLASCSDDLQLQQAETVTTMNGVQGKLVKAGFLGGSQAVDETRAFTAKANFVWMADDIDAGTGEVLGEFPQIGLCWTGVNPNEPEYGAAKEASANVFTNYLYEQVGWLKWGDTALEYDECTEDIYNGAFYQELYKADGVTPIGEWAKFAGTWNPNLDLSKEYAGGGFSGPHKSSRYNAYYYNEAPNKVLGKFNYNNPYTGVSNPNEDLNLGAGIFKTENSSVFEGQYIVYFPYNEDFKKGPIMARVGDSFTMDVNDDKYAIVSENAFQLGVIQNYGGVVSGKNREANFTTKNYSSTAQINLINTGAAVKNVRAVILYSAKDGIVYEAGIKANSVVAAKGDMSKVEQVEGTQKHNHSVYTYLNNSDGYTDTDPEFYYYPVNQVEHLLKSSAVKVPLPVLPCTVSDLQVIVMYDDFHTEITKAKSTTFVAGKAENIYIDLSKVDATASYSYDGVVGLMDNGYIAVDEESLVNAAGILYTTPKNGTIKLLRPIELGADADADGVEENADLYTAAGMPNAGELRFKTDVKIVADPSTLNCEKCAVTAGLVVKALQTAQTIRGIESDDATKKLSIEVPVIVEGTGCCATLPAELNIGGADATAQDVIAFTKTLTNYGNTNVGSDAGLDTKVTLATVENKYDDDYVKAMGYTKGAFGKKTALADPTVDTEDVANYGQYNAVFNIYSTLNTVVNVKADKLINYGFANITSDNALATADLTGARSLKVEIPAIENYGVAYYDGVKNFNDAIADGVTVDDIAKVVGGTLMVSDNALLTVKTVQNANPFSYVGTEGEGNSSSTDARIDVNAAGDSHNNGTWNNFGVSNFLGGNLQNQNGLLVDQLNGQIGGLRIQNGDKPTNKYSYIKIDAKNFDLENYVIRYIYSSTDMDEYQTDLNTGIYVAKVATEDRLAFLLNDAVEKKSVNLVEFAKRTDGGTEDLTYDFAKAVYNGKDLGGFDEAGKEYRYDVKISLDDVKFRNSSTNGAGYNDGVSCVGHCLDIHNPGMKFVTAEKLYTQKNLFVRTSAGEVRATDYNAQVEVGNNLYVEEGATIWALDPTHANVADGVALQFKVNNDVIGDETSVVKSSRPLIVGRDVEIGGDFETTKLAAKFEVGRDVFVGTAATFTSKGTPNIVERHYDLYGDAWFARYTTTTMGVEQNGNFKSYAGSTFEREQLSGMDVYRATVNVNKLALTDGTTTSGWPTQIDF